MKLDARLPIDGVPAMALAVWRATQASERSDEPMAGQGSNLRPWD
jgi:hypothetical protein